MISIVIPTFNRSDLISNCLNLLFSENPSVLSEHEVIITDDSTNNDTEKLIRDFYPIVKWIEGPKRGPAANRNNGAKAAKGEWLIFLDDDCLPQKEWLTSYINAINSPGTGLALEGSTLPDRRKRRFDEESVVNQRGNKLYSCNFAISRLLFEQLGGFDETFPFAAMEDLDFCERVSGKTQITFLPQALVLHPWRRIKPFKSFQKHLKSHKLYSAKHAHGFRYRLVRAKIFITNTFADLIYLIGFSFRGWPVYIEKCILNFCLIFV
jgi:GT2 family glycosyltransferase